MITSAIKRLRLSPEISVLQRGPGHNTGCATRVHNTRGAGPHGSSSCRSPSLRQKKKKKNHRGNRLPGSGLIFVRVPFLLLNSSFLKTRASLPPAMTVGYWGPQCLPLAVGTGALPPSTSVLSSHTGSLWGTEMQPLQTSFEKGVLNLHAGTGDGLVLSL